MPKTLTPMQHKYLAENSGIPEVCKPVLEKAFLQLASPRQSIRAKCLQCKSFNKYQIIICEKEDCALWHFRPFLDHGGSE